MAYGVIIFTTLIVLLELVLGCALLGWAGDSVVVERQQSPGQYWFAIGLQCIAGIIAPTILLVSG